MMGKTLLLQIKNPTVNSEEKIRTAMRILAKAAGKKIEFDGAETSYSEPTPYSALRELSEKTYQSVNDRLMGFFTAIVKTWLGNMEKAGTDLFKLNKKIYLNPKTGKYLTKADWAMIQSDLKRIFRWLYGSSDEALLKQAMATGRILQGMSAEDRIKASPVKNVVDSAWKELSGDRQFRHIVDFADMHTGELIQDVTERSRRSIVDTIMQGYNDRISSKELEDKLFDSFSTMNRDWRRIAETETATNFNNGYLLGELEESAAKEKAIFMQGISGGGACPFCASQVNGKIFVLLPEAPASGGDSVMVDGSAYTAIWPGKTNFGRKRANWWVSSGTQHPHCVPGGQLVATNELGAVTKAFYEGFVIEICTASGNRVTVTENHPVLTPDGFVAAKFLAQGSDIFVSPDPDGLHKLVNPDNYQRPTLVENLFASVRHSSRMAPSVMEVASEDFYGDGRFFEGDVDVVFTDSFLRDYFKAVFLKDFYEMLFSNTLVLNSGILLNKFRTSFQFLQGYGATPSSSLRFFSHLVAFFLAHPVKPDLMCFFASSEVDSNFVESVMQGIPAHSNLSSEFIQRFSRDVPVDDVLGGATVANSGSFVVPSRIVGLVRRKFSGHVYDLQDEMYGLYTCNGVVVKNCRCTFVRTEDMTDPFVKKMQEALKKYQ